MKARIPDLVVRGMSEEEILGHAPVMSCDRVHWSGPDQDLAALARSLSMTAWTRQWSDGIHRIWVRAGDGSAAREEIAAAGEAFNLRVDRDVAFRDLGQVPVGLVPELIAAAVDWLHPRTGQIRRKLVADLDLVDDEDVRPMMFLFVWDHLDRFDPRHGGRLGALNLCAYLLAKMRTWPQDASRAAYGRTVVEDQQAVNRAFESFVHTAHRVPTERELALACGVEVEELRRRRRNATVLARTRFTDVIDEEAQAVPDRVDVEAEALRRAHDAELTRALVQAAGSPLALAATYLSFWQERSRAQIADALQVTPKVAGAAVSRTVTQLAGHQVAS